MKRPTAASLKKVTVENLVRLGVDRLADILVSAAAARPELKRRLRMELSADQGAAHLVLEIDRRLSSLATSRSKVSWRQRPGFVRDLDVLRAIITDRLAPLDRVTALERLWRLMDVAGLLGLRVRDRDGELAAVFARAAADIGGLIGEIETASAAEALGAAVLRNPAAWTDWLPDVLCRAPPDLPGAALTRLLAQAEPLPGLAAVIRRLADAAGDVEAFVSTFTEAALRTPRVAAQVGRRLLAAGRIEAAGQLLEATCPERTAKTWLPGRAAPAPDFDWETVWIDYLEHSGQAAAAQIARWASFERTLSAERLRAYTRQLSDFQDVEAEGRAFELASRSPDFHRGLGFLIAWPAPGEAARMIEARADDLRVPPDEAELWAAKLRARYPGAAHLLLRKTAAAAFRRGEFTTADRLTQDADSIKP